MNLMYIYTTIAAYRSIFAAQSQSIIPQDFGES